LDDLNDQAKDQLRLELKRMEQAKDDFEIRRDAAKETLKRQWGD
jgi:hypothetical protein